MPVDTINSNKNTFSKVILDFGNEVEECDCSQVKLLPNNVLYVRHNNSGCRSAFYVDSSNNLSFTFDKDKVIGKVEFVEDKLVVNE